MPKHTRFTFDIFRYLGFVGICRAIEVKTSLKSSFAVYPSLSLKFDFILILRWSNANCQRYTLLEHRYRKMLNVSLIYPPKKIHMCIKCYIMCYYSVFQCATVCTHVFRVLWVVNTCVTHVFTWKCQKHCASVQNWLQLCFLKQKFRKLSYKIIKLVIWVNICELCIALHGRVSKCPPNSYMFDRKYTQNK